MFDRVPWFVGGDAEHSPEVARTLAYVAMQGGQGVLGPGDLKVTQLPVPGAGVAVASGVVGILNAIQKQQGYIGSNPTVDDTPVFDANPSGADRYDMLVARVRNPIVEGSAAAVADPVTGPFIGCEVIPGVPATARTLAQAGKGGWSATPLARIRMPAGSGTVLNAQITDLRRLMIAQSARRVLKGAAAAGVALTSSSFTAWPTANPYSIDVPEWATHLVARLEFMGGQTAAQVAGDLRLILGPDDTPFAEYSYNYAAQNGQARQMVVVTGEIKLPTSLLGTTTTLRMSGRRTGGTGNLFTVDDTFYSADVQFERRLS